MASLPLTAFDDYAEYDRPRLILQVVCDEPVHTREPEIEKLSYRARLAVLFGLTVSSWSIIGATVYAIGSAANLL